MMNHLFEQKVPLLENLLKRNGGNDKKAKS